MYLLWWRTSGCGLYHPLSLCLCNNKKGKKGLRENDTTNTSEGNAQFLIKNARAGVCHCVHVAHLPTERAEDQLSTSTNKITLFCWCTRAFRQIQSSSITKHTSELFNTEIDTASVISKEKQPISPSAGYWGTEHPVPCCGCTMLQFSLRWEQKINRWCCQLAQRPTTRKDQDHLELSVHLWELRANCSTFEPNICHGCF